MFTNTDPNLTNMYKCWSTSGKCPSTSTTIWTKSANFGRRWSSVDQVWPTSAMIWPKLCQTRVEIVPNLNSRGNFPTTFRHFSDNCGARRLSPGVTLRNAWRAMCRRFSGNLRRISGNCNFSAKRGLPKDAAITSIVARRDLWARLRAKIGPVGMARPSRSRNGTPGPPRPNLAVCSMESQAFPHRSLSELSPPMAPFMCPTTCLAPASLPVLRELWPPMWRLGELGPPTVGRHPPRPGQRRRLWPQGRTPHGCGLPWSRRAGARGSCCRGPSHPVVDLRGQGELAPEDQVAVGGGSRTAPNYTRHET